MTALRIISGFVAGLGLLTPTAQAMTEIPDCLAATEGAMRLDVFDLGNGMTSQIEAEDDKGAVLVVTNCFTGTFLSATIWTGPESARRDYPATMEEFDDATGEDAVVSIGQLAEHFEARDVPVAYGLNRVETCACAAAYPALRGTKQGYSKQ